MALEDYLTSTLQSADELYFNPQLAVPVAQLSQGDPTAAQAAAHASNSRTLAAAKKRTKGNWFSHVASWLGHAITHSPGSLPKKFVEAQPGEPGASYDERSKTWFKTEGTRNITGGGLADPFVAGVSNLNKPLAEVQHEYRAIRDVQERHGTAAALIYGSAVAAGSIVGGAVASTVGATRQGAVLGGELVGDVTGRTVFHDSWDRTEKGEAYKDSSGQTVSPGRDVARVLDKLPVVRSVPHGLLSGVSDGIFDLAFDPLAQGAGLAKKVGPARALALPSDVDAALSTRRGYSTFADIAKRPAEQIVQLYPWAAPVAADLGRAGTAEEAAQIVKEALASPLFKENARIPSWLDHLDTTLHPVDKVTSDLSDPGQIGHLSSIKRKFFTASPMSYDPEQLKFTRELKLEANDSASFTAVRNLLKMGRLPEPLVNGLVNDYINAGSAGERLKIIRGGMEAALFSTGIPDNQSLRQKIREDLTDLMGGIGMGKDGHYGFGTDGKSLSRVTLPDGSVTTAALFEGQTGSITMPSYAQFQSAARHLKSYGGALNYFQSKMGGIDDFLTDHVTARIRQTLLINPATGARLGLSEMFPNVLRQGTVDSLRASVKLRGAKAWLKDLTNEEADAVLAHRWELTGDLKPSELDKLIADQITFNHSSPGHVGFLPTQLDGGHFHPNDAVGQAEATATNVFKLKQSGPVRFRETDNFVPAGSMDAKTAEKFPIYWQRALREAGKDEGIQKAATAYLDSARAGLTMEEATRAAVEADASYLRGLPEMERSKFIRARLEGDQLSPDPIMDFAAQRVEAMRGLTHSPAWDKIGGEDYSFMTGEGIPDILPEAVPHIGILDNLAKGKPTSIDVLRDIEPVNRPITVKGRELAADLGGNPIDRLSNGAWKHVLGPTINKMARNRMYFNEVKDAFTELQPRVEAGLLSAEDAMHIAEQRAVPKMAKFIHNPEDRTQMHFIVQNFIPFYFAQEQAIRRYGRLLTDNPAAFRRLQLMQTGLATYTQEVKDKTGRAYVVMPGLGFLSNGAVAGLGALGIPVVPNVPTTVDGSVTSLNTIFPLQGLIGAGGTGEGGDISEGLRPNFSPLVTLAAKALDKLHPAATPLTTAILGEAAASNSIWSTLVPNTTLRNLMNAFGSIPGFQDQYRTAQISTFQALAHKQEESDIAWRKAGHRMDDPDRPQYIPAEDASPAERQKFVDRINNGSHIRLIFKALLGAVSPLAPTVNIGDADLEKAYQDALKKDGYPAGIENFLHDHPDAVSYTIAKSDAGKGATVPPYQLAESFYNSHKELFDKYPDIAAFFVPQDTEGKFDIGVYNEQLAQGLRHRKDLAKFMNDFYIAKGNHQYFNVDAPLHKANQAKLDGDTEGTRAENQAWSDYLHNVMARQHPIWWDHFTSSDRENERARQVDQLREIFEKKQAPEGVMADGIRKLLRGYNQHIYNLAAGSANHWTADDKQAEADNWQNYLSNVTKKAPAMSVVINAVFRSAQPTATEKRAALAAA